MDYFFAFLEVLQILALVGLIVVVALLAKSALRFKTNVVGHGKRLAQAPTQSVKSLIATGKGIAQQETVRFKHVGATVKETATVVQGAAGEVRTAAAGVHISDLKPVLANVQNLFKILSLATQFARTSPKQGAAPEAP